MVSAYQQFVKDHIGEFKHLPAKQRMSAVAQLYKKGSQAPVPAKKGRGRPKKGVDEKGGSIFGDLVPFGNMLGLGLDEKGGSMKRGKGRYSKVRADGDTTGGSIFGDIVPFGHMLGLGLDEKGGAITGAGMKKGKGRPKKEKGGSIFGDIVPFGHMLGLGLEGKGMPITGAGMKKSKGRPKKGGNLLEDIGDMMGLGLDGGAMTGAGMKKGRGRPSKKGGSMVESPLMSGDTGAGFGDWFFKGLTAPFALASKIPLPGLQQIGQAGTKAFNAIGAPTLF